MRYLVMLLLLSLSLGAQAISDDELLLPEEAFKLELSPVDARTLKAQWEVAEGYYLYRGKLRFTSNSEGITLGEPQIPPGKVKQDEFFGEVATLRGRFEVLIPLERAAGAPDTLELSASSQGCADIGVCYPPFHHKLSVALPPADTAASAAQTASPAPGFSPAMDSDALGFGGQQDEVLEPDQAFIFSTEIIDGNTLLARWDITPGHYLYRDKFTFSLKDAQGVRLGQFSLPPGEEKEDEFFGRIQVYHEPIEVRLPLLRDKLEPTDITLAVAYQGCAEIGICYPPIKKQELLSLPAGTAGSASAPAATAAPAVAAANTAPLSEQDSLAASLASGDTLFTLLSFFGLGLLLTFTPCVFPMIPILSSIIAGHGDNISTRKAFALSLVYVLAMALTYTVAGVIAGLSGANLQAAFQDPWILGSFAVVFVVLSLSMFGFYELQLPSALQSKLTEISNHQQGGHLTGVAIMGFLSALIVGPCVAPPLMGALIYISQTGDPYIGGAALFALSMGMGAPLLLIGTSAGKLLPKAGAWMDAVKAVFGVMLLAVAVWMLERILPGEVIMLLWALLAITSAIYMGALEPVREGRSGWYRLWKGLGIVLLIYGALLLIGGASGGSDPLRPLGQLQLSAAGTAQPAKLSFKTIKSLEELQAEVAKASAQGKPVMLDFYADWCISCKEFEKYTFSDPGVIAALNQAVLLKADVTANDETDQALLKHFGLIGPPSILFYNRRGEELRPFRLVGFLEPGAFRQHIGRAIGAN